MLTFEHLSQLGEVHNASTVSTGGRHRHRYTYAIGAPSHSLPLNTDEAVAHLRELYAYERAHRAYFRSKALTLRDEVLGLRARVAELEAARA